MEDAGRRVGEAEALVKRPKNGAPLFSILRAMLNAQHSTFNIQPAFAKPTSGERSTLK
jgi:hypothetical protein